jgi:hypothetical protein
LAVSAYTKRTGLTQDQADKVLGGCVGRMLKGRWSDMSFDEVMDEFAIWGSEKGSTLIKHTRAAELWLSDTPQADRRLAKVRRIARRASRV